MSVEYCYMCQELASSREHVPPLNLFPESRETGGIDYRKNLITVPSCELHNSAKSHDDEFLMVSLAGIIGNNSIGYGHKLGKVDRAIRRSSGRLLNKAIIKQQYIQRIKIENNKFIEVIFGTPDVLRLNKCFDHIARGLYHHHFNEIFQGNIKVHLGYLFYGQESSRNWNQFIIEKTRLELQDKPKYGNNSDVFCYQITDKDQFNVFLMRLCFYGGLDIYISFLPIDFKIPSNVALTTELMSKGIKTIITLGEKEYKIN